MEVEHHLLPEGLVVLLGFPATHDDDAFLGLADGKKRGRSAVVMSLGKRAQRLLEAAEKIVGVTGLASLDTLVARHTAAGLEVSVAGRGVPQPLESATDQAAYRILQEGLTNAARHGTGAAQVELVFGKAALELTISNAAVGIEAPRASGGHGLIGMRERATLLGGSLETGRDNGVFRVRSRLPCGGAEP